MAATDADFESPAAAPSLSDADERKAADVEALNAETTHEVIRRAGEDELRRSTSALAWSGLAGGLSMGFSLVGEGLLHRYLPTAEWTPLVSKLGYSFGFLLVILGSQQLFTENTLTPIVPLLAHRTRVVLANVARLWGTVLVTNLIGAFLFAWAIGSTAVFDAEAHRSFTEIARRAMEGAFGTIFLKGIFAGWLIAMMVWMLPAAKTAHVVVIVLVTWLVGVAHLAHIIAGSVESFYLVVRGELGLLRGLTGYVVPTLLGNVLGGVALVAALNHAQAISGGGRHAAG